MGTPGEPAATPTPQKTDNSGFQWDDAQVSSGKKFKFIHLIIVSIVFLLLGSYLAKVPSPQVLQTSDASPV